MIENGVCVKKILFLIAFVLPLAFAAGCGNRAPAGVEKSFNLDGREVSFIAPPLPWEAVMMKEPIDLRDGTMRSEEKELPIGVSFVREDQNLKGSFSVAVMDQNSNVKTDPKTHKIIKKEFIELENDQMTLDYIAMWVDKRQGKRTKQEYIKVAGVNAFHMVFEIGPEDERMKGEQVHFTKGGTHYSISMLLPSAEYSANVGIFQAMVSSFLIKSSVGQEKEPATSTPKP